MILKICIIYIFMSMRFIVRKSILLLTILNSVLGHERNDEQCNSFRVIITYDGDVLPIETSSKARRFAETDPFNKPDAIAVDSPSLQEYVNSQFPENYDFKNLKKIRFNATPVESKDVANKVFFQISDDSTTKQYEQMQFPVSLTSNSDIKKTQNSLNKLLKAIAPALEKLDSNGGEEMHKLTVKNNKEILNQYNRTNRLDRLVKNDVSLYNEDFVSSSAEENKSKAEEMKDVNNIIKHMQMYNITPGLYKMEKKEIPVNAGTELQKQYFNNYIGLWEQGQNNELVPTTKMTNQENGKTDHEKPNIFNLLETILENRGNINANVKGQVMNSEMAEKLRDSFKNIRKEQKEKPSSMNERKRNYMKNKKNEECGTVAVEINSPFILKLSTRVDHILDDLMHVNDSHIYTKVNDKYIAGNMNPTTVCNLLWRKDVAFVHPECTRHKGQITCKMGRYTYVINNGEYDISNDVLSKFIALIYRRSLEGDKCFDISVVIPPTEPCHCPSDKPKPTSTDPPKVDIPVTIVCTPIAKDKTPGPCDGYTLSQETIFECRWKKICLRK